MKRLDFLICVAAVAFGGALPAFGDGLKVGNSQGGIQPAATDFTSDTGGLPTFSQVDGYKAKVEVKHVSCGKNCWTHGLAKKSGNLNLTAKMGFACPAGDAVERIYYTIGNSEILYAYEDGGVRNQSVIAAVTLQPWTAAMYEGAAISALGPSWSGAKDDHHNTSNHATIGMHQDVEVFANCIEDRATRHKAFKVNTQAAIIDLE